MPRRQEGRPKPSKSRVYGWHGHLAGVKDTCVSAMYEAVEGVPDALVITDQYILEKCILPQIDPDKEVLAELMEQLLNMFRGKIPDDFWI